MFIVCDIAEAIVHLVLALVGGFLSEDAYFDLFDSLHENFVNPFCKPF